MTTIDVTEAKVEKVTGIELQLASAFRDYGVTPRDFLLASLLYCNVRSDDYKPGEPLLEVKMPCGQTVKYQKATDLPNDTVMCPCGDERHFVVRFRWVDPVPELKAAFESSTLDKTKAYLSGGIPGDK